MMNTLPGRLMVAAVVAIFGVPAHAQDEDKDWVRVGETPWKFEAAFYFWFTDLEGDIAIRDLTVEADADFDDLWDNLESAFSIRLEGWQKDEVGFLFDVSWTSLEQEPDFPGGEGTLEFNMGFVELAAATRSRRGAFFFDFLGGLRWVRFENTIDTPGGVDEENARDYFDPMIGTRIGADLAPWLTLMMRIDMAGFGVGTELSGNLAITAAFNFTPDFAFIAGWRSLGMEIDEDRYDADIRLRGPLLALNFGF